MSVIGIEEEGGKFASASPISSVPNIVEPVSEGAWRSTTLPTLATSPDLMVWEISERYTAWVSACHIKLGVAGAGSHFFNNINREAGQLYALYKKDPTTKFPKRPAEWTAATITTEAKLAAALTSAVPAEIMQTAVAISQGLGEIHLQDDTEDMTDYPMSLIILFSILDHIKPGTAEIRRILTQYIRSPPPQEDAGRALEDILRWKRAQRQATQRNIEKVSPSEYLDSFMGIIRPLTRNNRVLDTIVSNMEADSQYNDPPEMYGKECEDKIILHLKAMRAGSAPKSESTTTVMQVLGMPSDRNQQKHARHIRITNP